MTGSIVSGPPSIEWGIAMRPMPGETAMGDRYMVQPFDGGVLAAVVDGLGHGRDAAYAAHLATATLESHASDPLDSLVRTCHSRLRGTRGVVMSVAALSAREPQMSWIGVGNVECMVAGARAGGTIERQMLVAPGGVVGYELPSLAATSVELTSGDTIVFATDGIDAGFTHTVAPVGRPDRIAAGIMDHHALPHDDALVLVVTYRGQVA